MHCGMKILLLTLSLPGVISQEFLSVSHQRYREAQEIKILLGNDHVEIQGTRSLTTLKIITEACLPLSIKYRVATHQDNKNSLTFH